MDKVIEKEEEIVQMDVVARGSDEVFRKFILATKEDEMDDFYDRFIYFSRIYISRIYRYLVRDYKKCIRKDGTLSDALSELSDKIPPLYTKDDKIFFILKGNRYYIDGKMHIFWWNYITSGFKNYNNNKGAHKK